MISATIHYSRIVCRYTPLHIGILKVPGYRISFCMRQDEEIEVSYMGRGVRGAKGALPPLHPNLHGQA